MRVVTCAVVLALVVGVCFATGSDAQTNPIVVENALQGNPASEWDISGSGDPSIQGFATDISANRGTTIAFKIATTAAAYTIDIYRLGYYAGRGARKIASLLPSAALPQIQPACQSDSVTGRVDCGNWAVSASWAIPATAVSGIYIARLRRTDTGGASHIAFIVRDDASTSDLLFQASDTTWQAYNGYGGNSLYVGNTSFPSGHAAKVSYNRPFKTRDGGGGGGPSEDWLFNSEYPMLRWLEANGYDVTYSTDTDSDRRGNLILNHLVFLSVGHDEYWSAAHRANVEAARDAGVHLAFFSGNEIYWKVRWEDNYRTLVTYKEGTLGENVCGGKCDPLPDVWTGLWRDGCAFPGADGCRPENALSGQISWEGTTTALQVPAEYGPLRFWRNTSVASAAAGTTVTFPNGTLGYEWDSQQYIDSYPGGLVRMSSTNHDGRTHQLSLYRHASGALVFGAGTVQWAWGLDAQHDRAGTPVSLDMQQATVNILADMRASAATLRPGLVAATASTDVTPPISTITSPAPGASLSVVPVTIAGTASDAGGVVAGVEVSVDGGTTWHAATGRATWTYSWSPTSAGPAVLRSRAVDDSGNLETSGSEGAANSVSVTVSGNAAASCPCTIFPASSVPDYPSATDDEPIELGVKFRSSVDGYVTAIRFYKGAQNTGTHIGHLWSIGGTLLGTATFTSETASGWQEAAFPAPIAVIAGTTYVASYFSASGWYAFDNPFFGQAYVNGPLRALANGEDGFNAVYKYSAAPAFPTDNYQSSNYWVDVVFNVAVPGPDTTPPTVVSHTPASGAAVGTAVTATFNEAMAPASIDGSTFILQGPLGAVPVIVSYSAATHVATLTPVSALSYSTSYSVTILGGAGGAKDTSGNALASNVVWSFVTTAPPPPPPTEGPGGPILVISSAAHPFSRYYTEILRAEGLNAFTAMDISQVTAATLSAYDVVVLGEFALDAAQVSMLTTWVSGGGNLIAMRPDKQLAGTLGLADAAATLANAYLLINTGSSPGAGLVNQTIQYHGTADRYTLGTASSVATLYSNAGTATTAPAVTLNTFGAGKAAAFTYDLARSIVYTRQGNPAWSGQERDGTAPIRSNDLYFGAAAADPQPDWVDLTKVAIPQADEQQRLLVNLILQMNHARKPLPRFWYLPRGLKAAVVMTGDDHGNGGTLGRFNTYLANSPGGCSVDNWECVRGTSYIYPNTPITDVQVAAFVAQGFEIGVHVSTNCGDATPSALESFFANDISAFTANFPSAPAPVTNRTHCIAFRDYDTEPQVELAHGIRLDTNYYYWPQSWILDRPGMFTGSGMPMRFAKADGTLIDVYQAATQMTDESGQSYPLHIDALLDNALGASGYYGVFTANMHTDSADSSGSTAIVASAQARGVPVVTARQMLQWLDGRNGSSFGAIGWNAGVLTFTVALGAGADGAQVLLPVQSVAGGLASIARNGSPIAYAAQTIKGLAYAVFGAAAGNYTATYAPDTTPPVISAIVATPSSAGTATVSWTTNEPATSLVRYGTNAASLTQQASDAAQLTAHGVTLTGLSANTTYYYQVTSTDASSNTATAPASPGSFTTPSIALADNSPSTFGAGAGNCGITATGLSSPPALDIVFSGGLPAGWPTNAWIPGGGVTVAGGAATVEGAAFASQQSYGPNVSLEFMATLSGERFQHLGFAGNVQFDSPWIIFSTNSGGNALYARISGQPDVLIPGGWFSGAHRYRIDWTAASVVFSIDGTAVSTQTIAVPGNLLVVGSDIALGGGSIVVSQIRLSPPYLSACSFDSRVLDAGAAVRWETLSWTATTPAGTAVNLSYRTGTTPVPDGSWTALQAVAASGAALSGTSRYIQYRAALTTSNANLTPQLNSVGITYSAAATVPPAIGTQPASVTILSGQTTTLSVGATGQGPLAYQWYRGTTGDVGNPILGAAASSFTTPALTATAYYWVRVTNAAGPADSVTAAVIVVQPPLITTGPGNQQIATGHTATLGVVASGTVPLSYQWYRGPSGDVSNPVPGATSETFVTPALSASTSYWVRVGNAVGSADSGTATVTIASAEPEVQNVPAMPAWGLATLALLLVIAARAFARPRSP